MTSINFHPSQVTEMPSQFDTGGVESRFQVQPKSAPQPRAKVQSSFQFESLQTSQAAQQNGSAVKSISLVEAAPAPQTANLTAAAEALQNGRTPGQPGPYGVNKIEMTLGGNDVDVYLPSGPGPFPVNIYSTGLSHGQADARANANHFASWGMVTVVPSLKSNVNPVKNGERVERIIDDISQRNTLQGVALQSGALAVSGHSFGGLTSSLAADHPKVKALLALDPNDNFFQANPGKRNAHNVNVPAAFIFGDGGPNNLGPAIYEGLSSHAKYAVRLNNMPHLNFASRSQWPDKPGQQRALDFGTAFLLNQLGNVAGTETYLNGGAELRAAERKGELTRF